MGEPGFQPLPRAPGPLPANRQWTEGRNPFQLATQKLLHGLPLPLRARGEFVAHPLGDVADGDLD